MEGVTPIARGEIAFVMITTEDEATQTIVLHMPDRDEIRTTLYAQGLTDNEVWDIMCFIRSGLNASSYGFAFDIKKIKEQRLVPEPEMRVYHV